MVSRLWNCHANYLGGLFLIRRLTFNLNFSQRGLFGILTHDAVLDIIQSKEVTIGSAGISFVRIDNFNGINCVDAVANSIRKIN